MTTECIVLAWDHAYLLSHIITVILIWFFLSFLSLFIFSSYPNSAGHESITSNATLSGSSSHHHHGASSYQNNLPGASSLLTQDNLSTSTSSSIDRDDINKATTAICVRAFPLRSTGNFTFYFTYISSFLGYYHY